jgi:tRNA 2-thiouridine synthesizing protein D
MKYVLQINSSPYQSEAGYHGYLFAKTALAMGHQILRVFFYQEGIYHAFRYASPPDDERNLTALWSQLALEKKIDLVVCISSAQRRGLLHTDDAKRQQKKDDDVAKGFRISGLGQLVDATLNAERCLVFG